MQIGNVLFMEQLSFGINDEGDGRGTNGPQIVKLIPENVGGGVLEE